MRAETGPMRFGDDWTGVFIRGDNAAGYAMGLRQVLQAGGDGLVLLQVQGLLRLLEGSNEHLAPVADVQMMRPFGEAQTVGAVDPHTGSGKE